MYKRTNHTINVTYQNAIVFKLFLKITTNLDLRFKFSEEVTAHLLLQNENYLLKFIF
jgi:hypothetical protein